MEVPLLDLKTQYESIRVEIQAAVNRVLETQNFILGPEVKALEDEIAAYSGCAYGIGVSSGTDALLVALMALNIGPGDEVITSPYSFFATVGCIVRLGATPILIDIDPNTYNIDPAQIETAITDRTKAIIPVHLFGQTAEMDPIMALAERYGLWVIEDAAQAIGAEYHTRRAGSLGHMGCFSFFPSKNLGGIGDGGMVTTNDPTLADRLDLLRNHGHRPKYYNKLVGGNFRLDAIQAAVLRVKLPYLEAWTEARRNNSARYRELFATNGLAISKSEYEASKTGVVLPATAPQRRHVYNQFVIRVHERDALMQHLKTDGVGSAVYYPVALHQQECFRHLGFGHYPNSERAARETLALPIYPELTPDMQGYVVETIKGFFS